MANLRGAVPPYYRDVYDALCPENTELISQNILTKVMMKSGLDKNILSQIWALLDTKNGSINRSNLYKALALVAFAQNGKTINDKSVENFSGEELPRPDLGDVESLKDLMRSTKSSPTTVSCTFEQINNFDSIEVSQLPEKKGIFLKHIEYEVTSKRNNCTVKRRYSDFVAFYEVLQQMYPYRMIPKLPPKKMLSNSDQGFIELRRKSLRRFLSITSMHPAMYDSQVLQFFLSYTGEVVHKIKEKFRGVPDEYLLSPLASNAKDLVPPETQMEFAASKDQIRQLSVHVVKLRDQATRVAERSKGNSSDMMGFGKELIAIGNDTTVTSHWSSPGNSVLDALKKSFRTLSVEFSSISEKHSLQNIREEEGVVDQLNILCDILMAYQDLCDRHERGVLKEHHYALKKYGAMKTKRMAATITNMEQQGMDRMESRIQAQENEIAVRENRNYFALHCIHLETQLVYINMEMLADVITTLVATQMKGHAEMAKLWEDLAPRVTGLLPKDSKGGTNNNHHH